MAEWDIAPTIIFDNDLPPAFARISSPSAVLYSALARIGLVKKPIKSEVMTVISQSIQPSAVLLNTDEPTKPVKKGSDGREEMAMSLSQSRLDIFLLRKSESAPHTDVVYPPKSPKRRGAEASFFILSGFDSIDASGRVSLSAAPLSTAISDAVISGKRVK